MTEKDDRPLTAANLAYHLEDYHRELEDSLRHDQKFQLGATWGLVRGSNAIAAIIAPSWLINHFGLTGVIGGVAWFVIFIATLGGLSIYTERGYEGDLKKLSRVPEWAKRKIRW